MRILAIHNILWSHYKARIFNGIYESLHLQGVDFFVVQMAYSERSRLALKTDSSIHQYPYKVLFSDEAVEDISALERIGKLTKAVKDYKPDIIYLNGYYDIAYWFVVFYCRLNKVKLIIDFESNEISRKRVWWKEYLKMFFLRQCNGLVCLGQKAAEYAVKLKVPPAKILTTKNVGVDNDALLSIFKKESHLKEKRKKELNLPLYNFIYAGRFVERKNLIRLITAFHYAKYDAKNGKDWGLILSGEGEQKEALVKLVSTLTNPSVFFLDPCEWYEVPIRYTLADVAVLPSTFEPFGFLTNEAMVYSMPVLVSNRCGSAADLVKDGYNGFQFDPYNEDDLKDKLMVLMSRTGEFETLGANGKLIIDQWAPDIIVKSLLGN
ncbi:glycosyltransferase family 4 protein [Spirosoma panaciterrae]|uniref:glycosyltransferase family 4 protein n=1 Tax=Spirosoma panaciterrae TaxID=496058 RepID=UPI0004755A04|nr:glycosyltransferase family 4 protein [Spirosoma panaciterrae]